VWCFSFGFPQLRRPFSSTSEQAHAYVRLRVAVAAARHAGADDTAIAGVSLRLFEWAAQSLLEARLGGQQNDPHVFLYVRCWLEQAAEKCRGTLP